ncbi:ribonuclease E inhibitor RraB [Roseateles sp. BYS87W]|uniref:Ribonuclease E inhibitor RraB n=1 Tax=Pelomonas baiyunensis TaxID=3299026 RepID=A0ABW7H492_9BURK
MKAAAALSLSLALLWPAMPSVAEPAPRIELAQLETMFANMRARTPWNVDGPLLWGYFFFDADAAKLRSLSAELRSQGYKLVALSPVEGQALHRLHVEKVEAHTPQSLHQRNQQLEALAAKFGVASYDGMDVGPVVPAR